MHDGVGAGEEVRRHVADVAEDLPADRSFRGRGDPGQAGGEQAAVVADEMRRGKAPPQMSHQHGTHIAHVAGDDDVHCLPSKALSYRYPKEMRE